ncbi:MAG: MBL fold metallo-hydrolase [Bacilli bacterium]|nr:MBL fold metallo-hydrolase [Bacilli bacterium]
MLVSVLASGSEGNCTLIQTKNKKILIDLGMNNKYITTNLEELGIAPSEIDMVLITHTHADHTGAMKVFFKHNTPIVFLAEEMMSELEFLSDYPNLCFDDGPLNFTGLTIEIFKTSHDAPGSRGYIIKEGNSSFVYVTDTGYINYKLFDQLSNHDLYVFESNHDAELLMHGKYPAWLRARISSDVGHLSNSQAGFYLSRLIGPNTKEVVLAHISKENNDPELALATVREALNENHVEFDNLVVAKQRERTDCIEI